LVTGGASFIGSHLVDILLKKGPDVRVADDFSSGKLENWQYPLIKKGSDKWVLDKLTIYKGDLKNKNFTMEMVDGVDFVFHLAALHGGRGYIDSHPAECCTNMILDQMVFEESWKAGI
jgi:nucleoside-diphosphate-sugar epimerase